jgi:lipoate-protein ligase A
VHLSADRGLHLTGYWIDPTPRPGWENMALDHAMFDLAEETGALVWRLYRWAPWCLSFGRHEPASRRYDRARLAALGLDCVRRPTGGRAVWHARELTYAVAGPTERLGPLRTAYLAIHELLATAVRDLGLPAALAPRRTTPGLGAGACFAGPVGGELVVGAKKLLGSAQRRGLRALLQHGSLLLEDDQALVRSVQLAGGEVGVAETTVSALLGRPLGFEEAASAIRRALTAAGVPPLPVEGPNEVLRRAQTHYDTYRSEANTWER